MSIASWADDAYKFIRKGVDNLMSSGTVSKTVSKGYDKIVRPIGRTTFNFGLKAGATGLETTANVVDHFRRNADDYKDIGKSILKFGEEVGLGVAHEASAFAQAGVNAVGMLKKLGLVEKAPLKNSLIGWKFTGRGKLAITAGAMAVNLGTSSKDYIDSRTGRHDGQLHRLTPTMSNPYDISSQMASSQMGHSYANNAGATGDLVFALDNLNK